MRYLTKCLLAISCVGFFVALFPSRALADPGNMKTFFTFSAPVALPGVDLPAGTYMFKLAEPGSDRNLVSVFDRTGRTCYGTFVTVPDRRAKVTSEPSVQLETLSPRTPEAVLAWFYPGDHTGREFLYPNAHAND